MYVSIYISKSLLVDLLRYILSYFLILMFFTYTLTSVAMATATRHTQDATTTAPGIWVSGSDLFFPVKEKELRGDTENI